MREGVEIEGKRIEIKKTNKNEKVRMVISAKNLTSNS